MAQFRVFSPETEVQGAAVLSIVAGMDLFRRRAVQILQECGIQDLQPDQWYRHQSVLDAFRVIFERIGPNTVRMIGRKIPDWASFPPSIDSVERALAAIDVAYKLNHRGGNFGLYRAEPVGPRQQRVFCENPYPCDMDLGLIEGMADRFRPADSAKLSVEHEPGPCRKHGDDACTYLVSW